MRVADVDDDGLLDYVTPDGQFGVRVGWGAPGGTFSVTAIGDGLPIAPGPVTTIEYDDVSVADADADGDLDVAVANRGVGPSFLLENVGARSFVAHDLDVMTGTSTEDSHDVLLLDVDGDGPAEFLVLVGDLGTTTLPRTYRRTPPGLAYAPVDALDDDAGTPGVQPLPVNAITLGSADLNEDGLEDLYIGYYLNNDDRILVFEPPAVGSLTDGVFVRVDNPVYPPYSDALGSISTYDVAFADLNADGHLDAVTVGIASGPTPGPRLLVGQGDGTFMDATCLSPPCDPSFAWDMIVEDPVGCFFNALGVSLPDLDLDLDLDGDPDVAFALGDTTECPASFQSGNRLFENLYLQEQVFGPLTTVSPSFSLDEGRAAAGDIDDDGFDDVVVIDLDPTIFINEWGEAFATVGGVKYSNGDGSFGSASVLDLDNYGLPSGVAALEPIGPGGEQIVLTGGIEHTLRIVDRSTSPASITLLDQTVAGYFPMAPVTGDVDGDYVDDIMWASSGELRTLRSTVGFDMPPTVTSVADPAFVNPGFVKELRLADLNGDFNQDLVALVVPPAIVIPLPPEVHVFQWTDDCADPWEFIGCFEGVSILLPVQCEPTAIAVGQLVVPPAGLPLELVVGCASGELEVYSFAFDFSFSPPTELRPAALNVSGLAVLDFNIDSASDIAVIGNGTTAGAGKRDVFYYGTGGTWRHRALSKDTDGGIAVLLGDFAMSPGLETVFVGSTELRHVPIVAGIVPP